eukprot:TRINITY_DN8677_c0_g1_i1.p1 TRINITY_DN8677_c0_g1~~TRINITY_DN8677_c0_g1_i1.p1  ORF type:complete len:1617 (+),score=327.17 TRINITY_DN8677_c0_g1_i1:7-4857(+)
MRSFVYLIITAFVLIYNPYLSNAIIMDVTGNVTLSSLTSSTQLININNATQTYYIFVNFSTIFNITTSGLDLCTRYILVLDSNSNFNALYLNFPANSGLLITSSTSALNVPSIQFDDNFTLTLNDHYAFNIPLYTTNPTPSATFKLNNFNATFSNFSCNACQITASGTGSMIFNSFTCNASTTITKGLFDSPLTSFRGSIISSNPTNLTVNTKLEFISSTISSPISITQSIFETTNINGLNILGSFSKSMQLIAFPLIINGVFNCSGSFTTGVLNLQNGTFNFNGEIRIPDAYNVTFNGNIQANNQILVYTASGGFLAPIFKSTGRFSMPSGVFSLSGLVVTFNTSTFVSSDLLSVAYLAYTINTNFSMSNGIISFLFDRISADVTGELKFSNISTIPIAADKFSLKGGSFSASVVQVLIVGTFTSDYLYIFNSPNFMNFYNISISNNSPSLKRATLQNGGLSVLNQTLNWYGSVTIGSIQYKSVLLDTIIGNNIASSGSVSVQSTAISSSGSLNITNWGVNFDNKFYVNGNLTYNGNLTIQNNILTSSGNFNLNGYINANFFQNYLSGTIVSSGSFGFQNNSLYSSGLLNITNGQLNINFLQVSMTGNIVSTKNLSISTTAFSSNGYLSIPNTLLFYPNFLFLTSSLTAYNGFVNISDNSIKSTANFVMTGATLFSVNATLFSNGTASYYYDTSNFYYNTSLLPFDSVYFGGDIKFNGNDFRLLPNSLYADGSLSHTGLISFNILQTFFNGTITNTGIFNMSSTQLFSSSSLNLNGQYWILVGSLNSTVIVDTVKKIQQSGDFFLDTNLNTFTTLFFSGAINTTGSFVLSHNRIESINGTIITSPLTLISFNIFQTVFNGTLVGSGNITFDKFQFTSDTAFSMSNFGLFFLNGEIFNTASIKKFINSRVIDVSVIFSSFNSFLTFGDMSATGNFLLTSRQLIATNNFNFSGFLSSNALNTFFQGVLTTNSLLNITTDLFNKNNITLNTTLSFATGNIVMNGKLIVNSLESVMFGNTSCVGSILIDRGIWGISGDFRSDGTFAIGNLFSALTTIRTAEFTFLFSNLTSYPIFYSDSNLRILGSLQIDYLKRLFNMTGFMSSVGILFIGSQIPNQVAFGFIYSNDSLIINGQFLYQKGPTKIKGIMTTSSNLLVFFMSFQGLTLDNTIINGTGTFNLNGLLLTKIVGNVVMDTPFKIGFDTTLNKQVCKIFNASISTIYKAPLTSLQAFYGDSKAQITFNKPAKMVSSGFGFKNVDAIFKSTLLIDKSFLGQLSNNILADQIIFSEGNFLPFFDSSKTYSKPFLAARGVSWYDSSGSTNTFSQTSNYSSILPIYYSSSTSSSLQTNTIRLISSENMTNSPVVLSSSIGQSSFTVNTQPTFVDLTIKNGCSNSAECTCNSQSAPLGAYICNNGVWVDSDNLTIPVLVENSTIAYDKVQINSLVIVDSNHTIYIHLNNAFLKNLFTSNLPIINITSYATLDGNLVFLITEQLDFSLFPKSSRRLASNDSTNGNSTSFVVIPVMSYTNSSGSVTVSVQSQQSCEYAVVPSQSQSSLSVTLQLNNKCGKKESTLSGGIIAAIVLGSFFGLAVITSLTILVSRAINKARALEYAKNYEMNVK